MKQVKQREKVQLEDMGLYLRIIHLDYSPKSNAEIALLISEHFNVDCQVKDIEQYENLYHIKQQEDYEKLSRMVECGNVEHRIE